MAAAPLAVLIVLGVMVFGDLPRVALERPEPVPFPGLYERAAQAYRAGEWDEARRGFEKLLRKAPRHARVLDYLDRLEAIAAEGERLSHAEEALVSGSVEEANRLASSVPPHSPLFAQAEALLRVQPVGFGEGRRAKGGDPDALGLTGVLQEAMALYNEGRFDEAAARANQLAAEAQGPARQELLRWSMECARFGELYAKIPQATPLERPALADATRALASDRHLGGAYARELRPRVVAAYLVLVDRFWNSGDRLGACAHWVEGRNWEPREDEWGSWPSRCGQDALALLAKARRGERSRPAEAAKLYREVQQMLPEGDAVWLKAQAAAARLSSP